MAEKDLGLIMDVGLSALNVNPTEESGASAQAGRSPYLTLEDFPIQVLSRFHAFVQKTDACWLWMAGVDKNGYGQLARPHRSPIKTHRLAWLLAHGGRLSADQHILHRCDEPRCVNPAHLILGDQNANMRDAAAKGRLHVGRPNKRVYPDSVIAAVIEATPQRGVVNRLAKQFGMSKTYVSKLRRGLSKRMPVGKLDPGTTGHHLGYADKQR